MNKLRSARILICNPYLNIILVVLIHTACVHIPKLGGISSVKPDANQSKKKQLAEEPNIDTPMGAFEKRIYDLLMARDFAGIEAEANSARIKKERLRGGFWKIDTVYDASHTFYAEYKGQEITDEMWGGRIELLQLWKAKMPESITARVALAGAYMDYAWFARGDGYANTVTAEDSARMCDRLDKAEKELRDASELKVNCPRLYRELLFLGMVNGWPPVEFDNLYNQAIKNEPNYIPYYWVKSESLKPKWNGEMGDWQKYIDSLPNKLASLDTDEADIIYFAVVADKLSDQSFGNNWAMISKDRIKKGFTDIEKKFGPGKYRLNQFAYISCLTMDMESAKAAFDRIGNDRNDAVWGEQTFNMMKQIAQNPPTLPHN